MPTHSVQHRALLAFTLAFAVLLSPGRLHPGSHPNEASAIGSLRGILGAQQTFATSCGSGFYAPSLSALATTPIGGAGDGFIGSDLARDPSTKSGYWIRLRPGPPVAAAPASCNGVPRGHTVRAYVVTAEPWSTGLRYFASDERGVIYQSASPIRVKGASLPAGLTPIQ